MCEVHRGAGNVVVASSRDLGQYHDVEHIGPNGGDKESKGKSTLGVTFFPMHLWSPWQFVLLDTRAKRIIIWRFGSQRV